MKIELTDEEVTTILIALDNYRDQQEKCQNSQRQLLDKLWEGRSFSILGMRE